MPAHIVFTVVVVVDFFKMKMYVTELNVVTEARVEVHLFIPHMSVRCLLSSCHQMLTSYQLREALGEDRVHELLLAFLARQPSLERSVLVQKAWFARGRREGHSEGFWDAVARKDVFVEKSRYIRAWGAEEAVYERGDSVALAVQSGTIQFPKENGVGGVENKCHQGLRDLIVGMTNLDINFRLDINSVIERVQALQEEAEEKY